MVEIRNLVDCPEQVPLISRWLWEQWDHLRNWTLEQSIEESKKWLQRDAVPTAVVAFQGGKPIGCMSLLVNDLSTPSELGPWLACQYVVPEYRGHNVARSMVAALEERALKLGYKKLYMWTEHPVKIYQRLGWTEMFKTKEFGLDVTVMCKDY